MTSRGLLYMLIALMSLVTLLLGVLIIENLSSTCTMNSLTTQTCRTWITP